MLIVNITKTLEFEAKSGDYYTLGTFGDLKLTIGYYIDSLTIAMFCMSYLHRDVDPLVRIQVHGR